MATYQPSGFSNFGDWLSRGWEVANRPLVDIPETDSALLNAIAGFAEGMTSPLGLASMASTGGGSLAAKAGLKGLASAARASEIGTNLLFPIHGLSAAASADTDEERRRGAFEAALGGLGVATPTIMGTLGVARRATPELAAAVTKSQPTAKLISEELFQPTTGPLARADIQRALQPSDQTIEALSTVFAPLTTASGVLRGPLKRIPARSAGMPTVWSANPDPEAIARAVEQGYTTPVLHATRNARFSKGTDSFLKGRFTSLDPYSSKTDFGVHVSPWNDIAARNIAMSGVGGNKGELELYANLVEQLAQAQDPTQLQQLTTALLAAYGRAPKRVLQSYMAGTLPMSREAAQIAESAATAYPLNKPTLLPLMTNVKNPFPMPDIGNWARPHGLMASDVELAVDEIIAANPATSSVYEPLYNEAMQLESLMDRMYTRNRADQLDALITKSAPPTTLPMSHEAIINSRWGDIEHNPAAAIQWLEHQWKNAFVNALERGGYDSVIYRNVMEGAGNPSLMLIRPQSSRLVTAKFNNPASPFLAD